MSALVAACVVCAVALCWIGFSIADATRDARALARVNKAIAERGGLDEVIKSERLLQAGMNGGWVEGIAEPSNVVSLAEYRNRRAR